MAWRKGVRNHMAYINTKRCNRQPLYSHGLRRSIAVLTTVGQLQMVAGCDVTPLDAPSAITGLVRTYDQRYADMQGTLQQATCPIMKARAPAPRLSTVHDPMETQTNNARTLAMKSVDQSKLLMLQPTRIRMSLSFPDKRLIQWDCGKLQVLDTLLRKLQSEGHRCLIFTQMTKMLNVLEAWINIQGYTYVRLDGSTKVEDRQKLMDRFNLTNKYFLFILATRAGGLGINLTGADTVIFYDSDWNPTMDAQAQDRAHRIGQTRQVHIYRLVSEATVEENILRKANQKRLLDSVVIQSGQFTTDFFKGKGALAELFDDPSMVGGGEGAAAAGTEKEPSPPPAKGKGKAAKGKGKGKAAAEPEPAAPAEEGGGASAEEMEAAMMMAEDDEDRANMRKEKAAEAAEMAEFDESVPYYEPADPDKVPDGNATDTDRPQGGNATDTGAETDMEGGKKSARPGRVVSFLRVRRLMRRTWPRWGSTRRRRATPPRSWTASRPR